LKHPNPVFSFAFNSDWQNVLTNGPPTTAYLWDTATGKLARALVGHQSGITRVARSSDERMFLTGSSDQTARLWDAATSRLLGPPLPLAENANAWGFTSDNRNVVTINSQGQSRLWPAPEPAAGSAKRIRLWVEVLTNMELDDQGEARLLAPTAWRQRRDALRELGGPP
jgi:WD40 repeat protein